MDSSELKDEYMNQPLLKYRETELIIEAMIKRIQSQNRGSKRNDLRSNLSENDRYKEYILDYIEKYSGYRRRSRQDLRDHIIWLLDTAGVRPGITENEFFRDGRPENSLKKDWKTIVWNMYISINVPKRTSSEETEVVSIESSTELAGATTQDLFEEPGYITAESSDPQTAISSPHMSSRKRSAMGVKRTRKKTRSQSPSITNRPITLSPMASSNGDNGHSYLEEHSRAVNTLADINFYTRRRHVSNDSELQAGMTGLNTNICIAVQKYLGTGEPKRHGEKDVRNQPQKKIYKKVLRLLSSPVSPDASTSEIREKLHHFCELPRAAVLHSLIGAFIKEEIFESPLALFTIDPSIEYCLQMITKRGAGPTSKRIIDICSNVILDAKFDIFHDPNYQSNTFQAECERKTTELFELTSLLFIYKTPLGDWREELGSICTEAMNLCFQLNQRPERLSFTWTGPDTPFVSTKMQADGRLKSEDLTGSSVMFPFLPGVNKRSLSGETQMLTKMWVFISPSDHGETWNFR